MIDAGHLIINVQSDLFGTSSFRYFAPMALYTDQLGRIIELQQPPKRIVSLVPSQTELLYDLGLDKEVMGITKFCVHPHKWFKSKTRVGGTKELHLDKIKALQPDLIIGNKEENKQEQIEELADHFPVWLSDINTLQNAYEMILCIGKIAGRQEQAVSLTNSIQYNFSQLRTPNLELQTCYLIWYKPYMTVGEDTFINEMMKQAGFQNLFARKTRYPQVSIGQLQNLGCELLLLSSEPFPFKQKHIEELQALLPSTKMMLVNGEMFSWYGSRLIKAPTYFQQLQNQILSLSHAGNR